MKLEKRSEGAEDAVPAQETTPSGQKNKPVIVYIMILFIVAFLLMALSLLMHQRSNAEVIGTLRDSVTSLQQVQSIQDKNIQLQEDLNDAQDTIESLTDDISGCRDTIDQQALEIQALESLYVLQQEYAAQDYDGCKETLQTMEDQKLSVLLPVKASEDGVTSPADRYQQLKEAVLSH